MKRFVVVGRVGLVFGAWLAGSSAGWADGPRATVVVEEQVATCRPPENGAGPYWCYGSPLLARRGDRVFASVMETGEGVPPLCNTRWRLFERGASGWREVRHDDDYRQREPCPLVTPTPESLLLSVNPSTEPRGTKYGRCVPQVLRFDLDQIDRSPQPVLPDWGTSTHFTDHSYRGIAADGKRGDVLALNIDATTSKQHWRLMHADGRSGRAGAITFPIRSCYPQVALRDGAAHVLAIGDVVEPNAEWRAYKKAKTGADWDYVFRRLFHTSSPDLTRVDFAAPIEVDSVDATAGHITNLDLWIGPDGTAHLLYLRTNLSGVLRERYFPGKPMETTLEHVEVRDGAVTRRSTLMKGGEKAVESPRYARFHATADGTLHVVATVSGRDREGRPLTEMRLVRLNGDGTPGASTRIGLREPFSIFFTAPERGGNLPSNDLDLLGSGNDGQVVRYARIRIE